MTLLRMQHRVARVTLDYVILGRDQDDQGEERRKLLLFNGALPSLDPAFYARIIELAPLVNANGAKQTSMALVAYDEGQMLLVVNQPAEDEGRLCTDHHIFIPPYAVAESARQLEPWLDALPKATGDLDVTLPLLHAPMETEIDAAARGQNLKSLLDKASGGDFEKLLGLLGALIDPRQLVVQHAPADFSQRLAFIAGLQALLPAPLARSLTFASSQLTVCQRQPQIVFGESGEAADTWRIDWRDPQLISETLDHPYLEVLRRLWNSEPMDLAVEIQRMALLAPRTSLPSDLDADLRKLAERYWVDHRVREGDEVSTEVMIAILEGGESPSTKLRRLYIEKLLDNALNNRDSAAGRWVAEELDRDQALDAALAGRLEAMLDDQPDAVYVFVRNRLINLGVDERWLPRLRSAAQNSLEVAIQDGDVGTLAGWLELIAHEPSAYQLHETLKEGILSACKRAYDDGELGIQLILIAARRVPEIVDDLYADASLIAALESAVRAALQEPSVTTLDALIEEKAEYFLLALYHGLSASDALLVSGKAASRLIALAESDQRASLPAMYRAPALIRLVTTQAATQVSPEALDRLLRYILHIDDRAFIARALAHLAEHDLLLPRLGKALQQDGLPPERALSVMQAVSAGASAAPQDVITCYFALLEHYDWGAETQRLTEALARLLAKHHELRISYHHLWRLFEACHEFQSEAAMRIVMTQLMIQLDGEDDLAEAAAGLGRICRLIAQSKPLQDLLNNWWREYTHERSLPQLQRLQRELDKQRHLEDQKHILKTVVAMRRWLHSRGPAELAEAVNTAFIILEDFAEAFDSATHLETDPATIRREVDRMSGALSSEERHILANNMRNLARRIAQMAEKRSKPSLMRSDDSIDRQLMQGEANPHGSIDMLKWIAGYLDGAHPKRDE